MDMNQYMGMFMEESREHLQTLNRCLLELEAEPENISVLDEIFRSAHTIKGMSATMGFTVIAELTHEMENVLDLLRKETLKCTHEIVDLLFRCVDTLERSVESVANGGEAEDVSELVRILEGIGSGKGAPASVKPAGADTPSAKKPNAEQKISIELTDIDENLIANAQRQDLAALHIKVALSPSCVLKAARVYMIMTALEDVGEVIKTIPPSDDLEKENFSGSFDIVLLTGREDREIQERLFNISEVATVEIEKLPDMSMEPVPVAAAAPDKAHVAVDKPNVAVKKIEDHAKMKSGQSVRVDIDKLDTLLNIVGEIVINKTRLAQIGMIHKLGDLVETIEQMDRVTTELQAIVMKIRMVPVGQVFNRFPRMIRDLSKELDKEINLVIEGEETELDRTVIDEIGDPLVHLLRNSVDHGVEHANDRKAAGKKPIGQVRLMAMHEGNNVVISVEDDGKGIDPEIIKKKAVEKGMITQQEADKMDDNEAVRIVFAPGFSTASVVSDVSGRGVGMDVVKTKIEALGGTVDVETKLGIGSKFRIRLPLTLAIIQALLVQVSNETYAIPLGSIDSTINIKHEDISTVQNKEVFLLRGQIIPIIRLDSILSVPRSGDRKISEDDGLYIVIVHMGDQKAGIIVDALVGQHDIVIKSLGKLMVNINVIAGATVLGDGSVALILDVGTLMQTS